MIAASFSLSSSSSSASASSCVHRRKPLRRSPSFPQIRILRSPKPPRSISATHAGPAAERQRETAGGYDYSYSRRYSSGGAACEPAGALEAAGSLYDVLGVSGCATSQEIKAAFRRLARERHPDVATPDRKGASAEEFMRIHAAYATLSDPDKRAEYDRRMAISAPRRRPHISSSSAAAAAASYHYNPSPASVNPSCSSTFPRRTWETDQCW